MATPGWTTTRTTVSNSSVSVQAATAAKSGGPTGQRYDRVVVIIQNEDATNGASVNLDGETATTVNGVKLTAGSTLSFWGEDCPDGAITAIRTDGADVVLRVTVRDI